VPHERVLVAIVKTRADLQYFSEQQWYRVPVDASITEDARWPPQWVAGFETMQAGASTQQVLRFARVMGLETKSREELFPDVGPGIRAGKMYYRLRLGEVESLRTPLVPRRPRRMPFIWTSFSKLLAAQEFNDLFDDSPYEDALWRAFKEQSIEAERQWPFQANERGYVLDFALFCRGRSIDVEVDGRPHHSVEARSVSDAERDRQLAMSGWAVVRFRTIEVAERLSYCLERVSQAIRVYGGMDRANLSVRDGQRTAVQMSLMEQRFVYDEANGEEAD
jgi:very-short-patch-repair endonuclease